MSRLKPLTVVIMQPYFLPYRNYYGLIHKADRFVIYDDVQFCRGWQQRNMILGESGAKQWLTVPIISKRPAMQMINEVEINHLEHWQGKMVARIRQSYRNHQFFDYIYPELETILRTPVKRLIDLTIRLLQFSAVKMNLRIPQWYLSSEIGGKDMERTERLVYICKKLEASAYLCGPAAKVYMKEHLFERVGIDMVWHEAGYPEYPQILTQVFDHFVSVLDLIMNCGPESVRYMSECDAY